MSQFKIYNKQNMDYTLVSNAFLDLYLADANDAQIKVYLYLLRQISHQNETSVSALADHFNYTEKDVLRALNYWEKKGVLRLDFDADRQLSAVQLCEIRTEPVPLMKTVTYLSRDRSFTKPEYTLDQLAEFKNRDSASELLFIAESYLGKTLSANDIRSMLFISEELHFSVDLIDHLLQYCIDRGKKDFRYIEKVAISWAEAGITTPCQAETLASRYDKQVYTVMNALGKSAVPTPKETEFIKRWYQIYGFSSDIILEACERTVLATDKHRFEYADKILSSWKNAGVRHRPDIDRADASFEKKKNPAGIPPASKNKFNQFKQNEYDFDSLEKELLSN